jgi:hypothetical protein
VAEATIVNRYYVGVRLQNQVAIGICSPTLGDVTSIAVDLSMLLATLFGQAGTRESSQLITTRAGDEVDESKEYGHA